MIDREIVFVDAYALLLVTKVALNPDLIHLAYHLVIVGLLSLDCLEELLIVLLVLNAVAVCLLLVAIYQVCVCMMLRTSRALQVISEVVIAETFREDCFEDLDSGKLPCLSFKEHFNDAHESLADKCVSRVGLQAAISSFKGLSQQEFLKSFYEWRIVLQGVVPLGVENGTLVKVL